MAAQQSARPPVRVRFRFDVDSGAVEFIVDDSAPDRSDDYHDKVAEAIGRFLARHPEIADAGHIRYRLDREWHEITAAYERKEKGKEKDEEQGKVAD